MLPAERTMKGTLNGRPASPATGDVDSNVASAYSAALTQDALSITGCIDATLHWEKDAKPLTDGAMMNPPFTPAQGVPAAPSCAAPKLWPSSCAMISARSEEHTSELQSPCNLVCRLLLEKNKTKSGLT